MWILRGVSPVLLVLLAAMACKGSSSSSTTASTSASVSASAASASASASNGLASVPDDQVQPVYPLDPGPSNPLVDELCKALHDTPEERRAACCKQAPGLVFTSECQRNLGAALNAKAIALDAKEVEACVAAIEAAHVGCAWVGPNRPPPPKECLGIVHGAIAENARCRSSLECAEGMRCHGAGPTTPGVCGKPHDEGGACGGGADALATYTAQIDWETRHAECTGACDRRRCTHGSPVGGACTFDAMCEAGGACVGGKCAKRVEAKLGASCPSGACEAGARCVKGTCITPKKDGEACTLDAECAGGCLGGAGKTTGKCGMRCDLR